MTINANNGIKKKRFSLNIVNVKPGGAESSDEVETENMTFAPTASTPVKEESVAPWQTVTEAIQEIPAEYVVDQSCKLALNMQLCLKLIIFFPSISGIQCAIRAFTQHPETNESA